MIPVVSFPSVLDDCIDYLGRAGVRAVGSHPGDNQAYVLLWLGGGRQLSKVTAEVVINFEVWVPKKRATADGEAEALAEQVRALVAGRAFHHEEGITTYSWEWPGMPANMPPGEDLDAANWARVVFNGQVIVRGQRFTPKQV